MKPTSSLASKAGSFSPYQSMGVGRKKMFAFNKHSDDFFVAHRQNMRGRREIRTAIAQDKYEFPN